MAIPFLNNIDLNKFQIYNLRLQNLAAAPGSPVAGLVYYDTNLLNFYGYNGSSWVQMSGGGGGGVSSVALSAPSIFTVSGSPITTSGTLNFSFNGASTSFLLADGTTVLRSTYATIASPTFTGTVTTPALTLSGFSTGTLINTSGVISALSGTNLVLGNGTTIAQSTFQAANANLSTVAGYSSLANLTSLTNLANPGSTAKLQITSGGVMSWDTTTYLTAAVTTVNSMNGPGITIAGTTNQVNVANATNTVTLSLPQSIATSSSPTFASITISNAPSAGTDAVNKTYVDNAIIGLRDYKESVKASTTANITLSAPQTIDGISVVAGDRVLVLNQSTASQNGIYVVAAGAWTRSSDFAVGVNTGITLGMYVYVDSGTTNGQSGFVLSASSAASPEVSINVGTDTITFTKFSGATLYTHTTGLRTNGTTISVGNFTANGLLIGAGAGADVTILAPGSQYNVLVAGASGVPAWGTINLASSVAVGSSILPIGNGGTGASSASAARTALGTPGKYAGTLTGDGTTTSFTVTHNLGTQNVTWSLADSSSPRNTPFVEVTIPTGGNTLTFIFGTAPTNGLVYNVTVIG